MRQAGKVVSTKRTKTRNIHRIRQSVVVLETVLEFLGLMQQQKTIPQTIVSNLHEGQKHKTVRKIQERDFGLYPSSSRETDDGTSCATEWLSSMMRSGELGELVVFQAGRNSVAL